MNSILINDRLSRETKAQVDMLESNLICKKCDEVICIFKELVPDMVVFRTIQEAIFSFLFILLDMSYWDYEDLPPLEQA